LTNDTPGAFPRALSVMVVGSLHHDILVDAPDRPRKGETIAGRAWRPKFGGKGGNQAVAARRQGVPAVMAGAVGDDGFGAALLAALDRADVDRRHVSILAGVGSGMSVAIFDDEGDYGAVIVSGANLRIDAEQASRALSSDCAVLILQNEIAEAVNATVTGKARDLGLTIILNAAPARPFSTDLPDLVDILVVNGVEAEMMGAGPVTSLQTAASAAERLAERFGSAIVTAGASGVALRGGACQPVALPGIPVQVASTHGAGDAFVGTLAARLALGAEIGEALSTANQEAARVVSTPEDQRL
jgi:ribokinase